MNITDGDPDKEADPGHGVEVDHEGDVGRYAQRWNERHQRHFEEEPFGALLVRRYNHQRYVTHGSLVKIDIFGDRNA